MSVEFARQYRKVRKAVGPQRRFLVWGSMVYGCQKSDCDFEHRVLLGVGCEGPPKMKEEGETIPVPMICGQCPKCGGPLSHDRWNDDEDFGEERERAVNLAAFVIPGKGKAKSFVEQGFGGAAYVPAFDPLPGHTPPR